VLPWTPHSTLKGGEDLLRSDKRPGAWHSEGLKNQRRVGGQVGGEAGGRGGAGGEAQVSMGGEEELGGALCCSGITPGDASDVPRVWVAPSTSPLFFAFLLSGCT